MDYIIKNTDLKDLDFACSLFEEAISYQKRKGYPEYRWDDREMQKEYILTGRHFKVVLANEIASVFNIQFNDENIWREMDKGRSIYLHGVLTNPKHKGKRIFGHVLNWTIAYALANDKTTIRLDTWSNNPDLTNYYATFGFKKIEDFQIPNSCNIPFNCRGNKVTLMEYKI